MFLTGNTINLIATISSDGTGTIAISGDGVTLPNNSRVAAGEKLAVANDEGRSNTEDKFIHCGRWTFNRGHDIKF